MITSVPSDILVPLVCVQAYRGTGTNGRGLGDGKTPKDHGLPFCIRMYTIHIYIYHSSSFHVLLHMNWLFWSLSVPRASDLAATSTCDAADAPSARPSRTSARLRKPIGLSAAPRHRLSGLKGEKVSSRDEETDKNKISGSFLFFHRFSFLYLAFWSW